MRYRFEEQLHERHDAEMQRLQAEEEKVMDMERDAQATRLKEKQVWRVHGTRVVKLTSGYFLVFSVWG